MANLTRAFRLLELTRNQPQYGFALAGIPKGNLPDLAQHHYLVTAFAWQICRAIRRNKGTIDMERTLEICLAHDLGELFGGDIALPYQQANPAAREAAKAFERENQKYVAEFLADGPHLSELFRQAMEPASDEALVAKIADYMEVTHFKLDTGKMTPGDVGMIASKLAGFAERITDGTARKTCSLIVEEWVESMKGATSEELFEADKNRPQEKAPSQAPFSLSPA